MIKYTMCLTFQTKTIDKDIVILKQIKIQAPYIMFLKDNLLVSNLTDGTVNLYIRKVMEWFSQQSSFFVRFW